MRIGTRALMHMRTHRRARAWANTCTYTCGRRPSLSVVRVQVLRDGCYAALGRYPETEAEDAALMENSRLFAGLPRNARMAVKLRRNEKRILLRTIRTTETACVFARSPSLGTR